MDLLNTFKTLAIIFFCIKVLIDFIDFAKNVRDDKNIAFDFLKLMVGVLLDLTLVVALWSI